MTFATDTDYMRLALRLARKGEGRVNPNPLVGAVIVRDGVIIGQGYHQQFGGPHAERMALASLTEPAKGATLYVNLEPCCHHGKTPPCTDAIIASGIRRVVVGTPDPNPLVAGRGLEVLRNHGIEVTQDVLTEECARINQIFFHFIRTNRPYVIMKYAMTMDGKTATFTGQSQWITGEAARRMVHRDRNRICALMTGVGTILADDPLLTCRLPGGRDPVRIVCDTHLRTPLTARIVATAARTPTILATCCEDKARHLPYEQKGCKILTLPAWEGHVDLSVLMKRLGERKIDGILLEGGGTLNWSALSRKIVNKVQAYIAPEIFGGLAAPSPVSGSGTALPDLAFLLKKPRITRCGRDILLESEVEPCLQD